MLERSHITALLEWMNHKFKDSGYGYPTDEASIDRWWNALKEFQIETLRKACKTVSDLDKPPPIKQFIELCINDPFNTAAYDPAKARQNIIRLRKTMAKAFSGEFIGKIEWHAGMNGRYRQAVDDYNNQIPLYKGSRIDPKYIPHEWHRDKYQQELDDWGAEQTGLCRNRDTGVRGSDQGTLPESEADLGEE